MRISGQGQSSDEEPPGPPSCDRQWKEDESVDSGARDDEYRCLTDEPAKRPRIARNSRQHPAAHFAGILTSGEQDVADDAFRRMSPRSPIANLGQTPSVHVDGGFEGGDISEIDDQVNEDVEISMEQLYKNNLYISEPRSFSQRNRSCGQNTFEVVQQCTLFLAAAWAPSAVSLGFVVLSHFMLCFGTATNARRLRGALTFQIILCIVLASVIVLKALAPVQHDVEDYETWRYDTLWYDALGFRVVSTAVVGGKTYSTAVDEESFKREIINKHNDLEPADLKIELVKSGSFGFETVAFIVLLLYLYLLGGWNKALTEFTQTDDAESRELLQKMLVVARYSHLAEKYTKYDSDAEVQASMGLGSESFEQKSVRQRKKQARKDYMKIADRVRASLPTLYFDCYSFATYNKLFFLLILLMTLVQAVTYNGLIDIPSLFLILAFMALYAFRSSYFSFYMHFTMFFVYYMSLITFVKIVQEIAVQIPFLQRLLVTLELGDVAKLNGALFGFELLAGSHDLMADNRSLRQRITYEAAIVFLLFFLNAYRTAKWSTIRDKANTGIGSDKDSFTMFEHYISNKDTVVTERERAADFEKKFWKSREKELKQSNRRFGGANAVNFERVSRAMRSSDDVLSRGGILSWLKSDMNRYLPSVVMWALRVLLCFQAYLYHSILGYMHLTWVLATFIFSERVVFFFTAICFLPVYAWEFCVVYGMHAPWLNEQSFFKSSSQFFVRKMAAPVAEQSLYFVILALLFTTVSCLKLTYQYDQEQNLRAFFKVRIRDETRSVFWKLLYVVLSRVQFIVLVCLFYNGLQNLNNLKNLGFMVFFTIYTASDYAYRKSNLLLTIFISFFIIGQYHFSLFYYRYVDDEALMATLKFMNLFKENKVRLWTETVPVYFRHVPYPVDFFVLCLTALLNIINTMYHGEEGEKMMQECDKYLRENYFWWYSAVKKVKIAIDSMLTIITVILILYLVARMPTNLISWLFFTLNCINLTIIAKSDNKVSTLRGIVATSTACKVYAVLVLLIEIIFTVCFGGVNCPYPNSWDCWLQKTYPTTYSYLQIIGLRMHREPGSGHATDIEVDKYFRAKFISYVLYLLLSLYLESSFQERMKHLKDDEDTPEERWGRLFEYCDGGNKTIQNQRSRVEDSIVADESMGPFSVDQQSYENLTLAEDDVSEQSDCDHSHSELDVVNDPGTDRRAFGQSMMMKRSVTEDMNEEEKSGGRRGLFREQGSYNHFDLLDVYESVRGQRAYMAYRCLDWWPVLDSLATYGHVISNSIIVVTALYFSISGFMLVNVLCVCIYYAVATTRLHNRAQLNHRDSGLQDQCDLRMAGLIHKQYKIASSVEFLRLRAQIWKVQIFFLMIMAIIGFPTSVLGIMRGHLDQEAKLTPDQQKLAKGTFAIPLSKEAIDTATFWCFIAGIYKDPRAEVMNYFYVPLICIAAGLYIERFFINWLENRLGCNYQRFQKYTELELRIEQLESMEKKRWRKTRPPKYNTERYANFYFHHDFDDVRERFTQKGTDGRQERKFNKKNLIENRDFIPYQVAVRLKTAITLSVKIDGRAPDIVVDADTGKTMSIDEPTRRILRQYDAKKVNDFHNADYDFEYIDIFKEIKMAQLGAILRNQIDRKYKLSLAKGMKMVLESLILLILMTSVVLKANIFSIIYMLPIFRYVCSYLKIKLLVRVVQYMALLFIVQYVIYWINLTAQTSPTPFPEQFKSYPYDPKTFKEMEDPADEISYAVPVFFRTHVFRHLRLALLLGIGVQRNQLEPLILDFVNLYLVSMYLYHYGNPLLEQHMKKVFWSFPSRFDDPQKYSNRLSSHVLAQTKWLLNPKSINQKPFNNDSFKGQFNEEDLEVAEKQYAFALKYSWLKRYFDLNKLLINYVDIKYKELWSDKFCREKKWEMKQLSPYFRLVKKGSILVYLTFHLFTIFLILLTVTIRQSLLAFVYAIIILPFLKASAEVLTQRLFAQESQRFIIEGEIHEVNRAMNEKLEEMHPIQQEIQKQKDEIITIRKKREQLKQVETGDHYDREQIALQQLEEVNLPQHEANIVELKEKLKRPSDEYRKLTRSLADLREKLADYSNNQDYKRTFEERAEERELILKYGIDSVALKDEDSDDNEQEQVWCNWSKKSGKKQPKELWAIYRIVNFHLLAFAIFDFTCQVLVQLPIVPELGVFRYIGIKKVWKLEDADSIGSYYNLVRGGDGAPAYRGLQIDYYNFAIQMLTSFVICILSLQIEIFHSPGYDKFVTQKDGSLDLLVTLAVQKAQSMAYLVNNLKVQQIVAVQKRREIILTSVQTLKDKLNNWRRFTQRVLDPGYAMAQEKSLTGHPASYLRKLRAQYKDVEQSDYLAAAEAKARMVLDENQEDGPDLGPNADSPLKKSVTFADGTEHKEMKMAKRSTLPVVSQTSAGLTAQRTGTQKTEDMTFLKRRKRLPRQDVEPMIEQMAHELVAAKKAKLNWPSWFYIQLQTTFVNQLLFVESQEDIDFLALQTDNGAAHLPCELEIIMYREARQLIYDHYESLEGHAQLFKILRHSKLNAQKSLLEISELESKIKLKQMRNTWKFTRRGSICCKLQETNMQIFLSNTQNLCFLWMLLSMQANAGIISLVYPISIFGYAMLEETRPRKEFWNFVLQYTRVLLVVKFLWNLSVVEKISGSDWMRATEGSMRIGLHDLKSTLELTLYLLPELLIVATLQLNEIMLRLLGLHYEIEEDIEPMEEAVQRSIRNKESAEMDASPRHGALLHRMFISRADQHAAKERHAKEEKQARQAEVRNDDNFELGLLKNNIVGEKEAEEPLDLKTAQEQALKEYGKLVWHASRDFTVPYSTQKDKNIMERMRDCSLLRKSLQNDHLKFIEGNHGNVKIAVNTLEELHERLQEELKQQKEEQTFDVISAFDYPQEVDEKKQLLKQRSQPEPGLLETVPYINRIFPSLRIQKPGHDLYGPSTLILMLIAGYIFMFFDQMTVTEVQLLQGGAKKSNNIFKGAMAIAIVLVFAVAVIERYISRSDTKAVDTTELDEGDPDEERAQEKQFFSHEVLKGEANPNQMTIRVRSFATAQLDVQSESAQAYLKHTYGRNQNEIMDSLDKSSRNITGQERCKLFLHWTLLISIHAMVFWILPITGNMKLFNQTYCKKGIREDAFCMDYHTNSYFVAFYWLWVLYFTLSAHQLRYGLPIKKIASSVLTFDTEFPGIIIANVYIQIPFAIELRCLLDFTFSRTALDVFQFTQTYSYHMELYLTKLGNKYYNEKQLGTPTEPIDKCINGWLFTIVFVALLIGPFLLFSELSGFVQMNPVTEATIQFGLTVGKNVTNEQLMQQQRRIQDLVYKSTNEADEPITADESSRPTLRAAGSQKNETSKNIEYTSTTFIYEVTEPYLSTFDQKMFNSSRFANWTETRFFKAAQIQQLVSTEYSDQSWSASSFRKDQLWGDLKLATDPDEKDVSLQFILKYKFTREFPPDAKITEGNQTRVLNQSLLEDCITAKQIADIVQLNCSKPENQGVTKMVHLVHAYNQAIILGATDKTYPVYQRHKKEETQKNDIRLLYRCPGVWLLQSSQDFIDLSGLPTNQRLVDPKTCRSLLQVTHESEQKLEDLRKKMMGKRAKDGSKFEWARLQFALFSMLVSSSFLASYNVTTFYTAVVLMVGNTIRGIFLFGPWTGFIYEITHPEVLLQLVEGVYLKRHERDLVGEEEYYRMLVEIMRSPELLKALTGSSLKGACSSTLDKLPHEMRNKLFHLDKLQRKGYEVEELRQQIIKQYDV